MNVSEELPTWNLGDLYSSPEDANLEADLAVALNESDAFKKKYEGQLSKISGSELAVAIAEYESILDKLYKVMSYAQLLLASDMGNADVGRFYQTLQERITDITAITLFFSLELNQIDDNRLASQLEDRALQAFKPWIDETRVLRPHQLPDELEKLLGDTKWKYESDRVENQATPKHCATPITTKKKSVNKR